MENQLTTTKILDSDLYECQICKEKFKDTKCVHIFTNCDSTFTAKKNTSFLYRKCICIGWDCLEKCSCNRCNCYQCNQRIKSCTCCKKCFKKNCKCK